MLVTSRQLPRRLSVVVLACACCLGACQAVRETGRVLRDTGYNLVNDGSAARVMQLAEAATGHGEAPSSYQIALAAGNVLLAFWNAMQHRQIGSLKKKVSGGL